MLTCFIIFSPVRFRGDPNSLHKLLQVILLSGSPGRPNLLLFPTSSSQDVPGHAASMGAPSRPRHRPSTSHVHRFGGPRSRHRSLEPPDGSDANRTEQVASRTERNKDATRSGLTRRYERSIGRYSTRSLEPPAGTEPSPPLRHGQTYVKRLARHQSGGGVRHGGGETRRFGWGCKEDG